MVKCGRGWGAVGTEMCADNNTDVVCTVPAIGCTVNTGSIFTNTLDHVHVSRETLEWVFRPVRVVLYVVRLNSRTAGNGSKWAVDVAARSAVAFGWGKNTKARLCICIHLQPYQYLPR